MKKVCILLFIFLCTGISAQTPFHIVWYNVENLFDTADDPLKNDDEFLPEGSRHWTGKRYHHKLQQIARVITAAGEWDTPAIVGLCEVENDTVLTHLLTRTPLRQQQYRYCMTKGSDTRGINVALLWQRDKFNYIGHSSYPVRYTGDKKKPTRDILHLWGEVINGDTLDIFAVHFPSRSGGEKESEGFRLDAAQNLRDLCDSLYKARRSPHFILMGDFNDTPENRSIHEVLAAHPYKGKEKQTDTPTLRLYDLFADLSRLQFPGSHKYQGEWGLLDHIIVNSDLLSPSQPIRIIPESISLFAPDFILTDDLTHRGQRPLRTYYGFQYEAGFSDHLPLQVKLHIE